MKIALIIIGTLGGLFALLKVNQLVTEIGSTPSTAYGASNIAANVAVICIGLIVCFACFQRIFRKPKP